MSAEPDLGAVASRIRGKLVELSHRAGVPHLGSALSVVDVLVAAYFGGHLDLDPERPEAPDRDRFILSKGHAAPALYSTLAFRGYFPEEQLDTLNQPGSALPEQPSPKGVPGLEAATGSLGHGLPIGLGMALASRIQRHDYRVAVVMSDGECNEGTVWEAAMMAGAQKVENLLTIVDFNGWQATDRSREVMALEPLAEKFESFGWSAYDIDGHDLDALTQVFERFPDGSGKPVAVIANTVKGKGVSFMEDDNNWHYRIPKEDEVRAAHIELGLTPA
jgi:transketolase